MPTIPTYADQINFFFIIYEKDIPMTKEWRFLSTIRSRLNPSTVATTITIREKEKLETARIERSYNINRLPTPEYKYIYEIRRALREFFFRAEISHALPSNDKLPSIWNLAADACKIINESLANMDGTWIEYYGNIQASDLKLKSSGDFFEIVAVAHKFIDAYLKPLVKQLEVYQETLKFIETKKLESAGSEKRKTGTI